MKYKKDNRRGVWLRLYYREIFFTGSETATAEEITCCAFWYSLDRASSRYKRLVSKRWKAIYRNNLWGSRYLDGNY